MEWIKCEIKLFFTHFDSAWHEQNSSKLFWLRLNKSLDRSWIIWIYSSGIRLELGSGKTLWTRSKRKTEIGEVLKVRNLVTKQHKYSSRLKNISHVKQNGTKRSDLRKWREIPRYKTHSVDMGLSSCHRTRSGRVSTDFAIFLFTMSSASHTGPNLQRTKFEPMWTWSMSVYQFHDLQSIRRLGKSEESWSAHC